VGSSSKPALPLSFHQALDLDNLKSHHWQIQVGEEHTHTFSCASAYSSIQLAHCALQGCSAVTGDKLIEGMDWIVDDISSRIYMAE
jgi:hypothetical protein